MPICKKFSTVFLGYPQKKGALRTGPKPQRSPKQGKEKYLFIYSIFFYFPSSAHKKNELLQNSAKIREKKCFFLPTTKSRNCIIFISLFYYYFTFSFFILFFAVFYNKNPPKVANLLVFVKLGAWGRPIGWAQIVNF